MNNRLLIEDSRFKLGDIVQIVNYGRCVELLDDKPNEVFPDVKLIDVIATDRFNIYKWDFSPNLVGQKGVVIGMYVLNNRIKYKLYGVPVEEIMNEFDEEQLNKV